MKFIYTLEKEKKHIFLSQMAMKNLKMERKQEMMVGDGVS